MSSGSACQKTETMAFPAPSQDRLTPWSILPRSEVSQTSARESVLRSAASRASAHTSALQEEAFLNELPASPTSLSHPLPPTHTHPHSMLQQENPGGSPSPRECCLRPSNPALRLGGGHPRPTPSLLASTLNPTSAQAAGSVLSPTLPNFGSLSR